MSDHPTENAAASRPPFAGANPDAPPRNLSEILEELTVVTNAHQGDATAMRAGVSELTRALARLFEMIRADRAEQRDRIAELEHALDVATARVAELEAGSDAAPAEAAVAAAPAPAPNDFDQLRLAAERLRLRTEQLVREAGTPAEQAQREEEQRIEAARKAVDASIAEDASHEKDTDDTEAVSATERVEEETTEVDAVPEELPSSRIHDEPFDKPGVLRVFPGVALRPDVLAGFEVESDLDLSDEPQRMVAAQALSQIPDRSEIEPEAPKLSVRPRPEPIAIQPRPARKRRGVRRRKIDARKLRGVDPAAALRAMVTSVEDLWTAGNGLDLVIALTDGGTMRVSGGDRVPLRVDDVAPGTSARSTVTATREQLLPLFGRLDLTGDQSAPLIHGSRRDADLLVGWIDRAQRLSAEPL